MQGLQNRFGFLAACVFRRCGQAVFNVLFRAEMRKQRQLLKHIAHAPKLWGRFTRLAESNSAFSASVIRPSSGVASPAMHSSSVVFPAPGRPKQNRDPRRRGELNLQLESVILCGKAPSQPDRKILGIDGRGICGTAINFLTSSTKATTLCGSRHRPQKAR